jgi:hypothetical protein
VPNHEGIWRYRPGCGVCWVMESEKCGGSPSGFMFRTPCWNIRRELMDGGAPSLFRMLTRITTILLGWDSPPLGPDQPLLSLAPLGSPFLRPPSRTTAAQLCLRPPPCSRRDPLRRQFGNRNRTLETRRISTRIPHLRIHHQLTLQHCAAWSSLPKGYCYQKPFR